jgi:hypothetical protein
MPTVTVLAKAHDNSQLNQIDRSLKSMLEGLQVEVKTIGVIARGWVEIAVTGGDEKVALRFIADRIGLCPASLESMEKFSTVKGFTAMTNKGKNELYVDIGVFSPTIIDALIPLQRLQSQLGDGRKMALEKLVKLFGLCENLPLNIKIFNIDKEKGKIEAELSEKQLKQYKEWTMSLLDRLLILGTSRDEVELALKRARLYRDVTSIEPIGILEHAVVCKLGTDAAGLIPILGRNLGIATFSIFSPRRILGFL